MTVKDDSSILLVTQKSLHNTATQCQTYPSSAEQAFDWLLMTQQEKVDRTYVPKKRAKEVFQDGEPIKVARELLVDFLIDELNFL